jgi:hypothetical protein
MKASSILSVIVILSLVFLACGEDSTTNSSPPEYSRATPPDLFQALAYAMERKDIDVYAECLADTYQFEFDPQDWDSAGVAADKPWWGVTEDLTAMTAMFQDPYVTRIQCDLHVSGGPWQEEDETIYRLEPSIRVTHDTGVGEWITYWVFSSWFDVKVIEDPYNSRRWVFSSIAETSKNPFVTASPRGGALATEPTTFGSIKAMYKQN